jgi:hypothetical protein
MELWVISLYIDDVKKDGESLVVAHVYSVKQKPKGTRDETALARYTPGRQQSSSPLCCDSEIEAESEGMIQCGRSKRRVPPTSSDIMPRFPSARYSAKMKNGQSSHGSRDISRSRRYQSIGTGAVGMRLK